MLDGAKIAAIEKSFIFQSFWFLEGGRLKIQ